MAKSFPKQWMPPVAWQQNKAFTTRQAIAAGMSKRQVAYRLHTGLWRRVAGDALRHSNTPESAMMLARAAYLTWPDAIVCGPSVVALVGAPVSGAKVHVITPDRRAARYRLVPHNLTLAPDQHREWNGMKLTTMQRGFLDALAILPTDEAQSLFSWASTRARLTDDDLADHLNHSPKRWGNNRIRRFLNDARKGIMSEAERIAHEILHAGKVTGWTGNTVVRDAQGIIGPVDILFAKERLVLEVDGRKYHGDDRFQDDRRRDNRLVSAGYCVLHFTWADLTLRSHIMLEQVRVNLKAAGGGRRPQP